MTTHTYRDEQMALCNDIYTTIHELDSGSYCEGCCPECNPGMRTNKLIQKLNKIAQELWDDP